MTTHALSLPQDAVAIPQPAASETKLIEAKPLKHGPPLPRAPELSADWPTLSVLSRRYIDRALEHTRGNKTRAADLLGIDRRTLNRILVRDRVRKARPAEAAPEAAVAGTQRGVDAT
jgi:DNA-binding NtrC family response regulator